MKLKPCPFCGAPGEVREVDYGGDDVPISWTEVGCSAICDFSNTPKKGTHEGLEETIKKWNTRTIVF